MSLGQIFQQLEKISKDNGLSVPWICGGLPRDKVLGRKNDFGDVDLTTGNDDIHILAKELAMIPGAEYMVFPDGHTSIYIDNKKLDFSSNFNIPGIERILKEAGLDNPTEMQKEMFSRDFTCNSLLLSLDLQEIQDPTGLGMKDIGNKILNTVLPANFTLGYDNKRIVRVLYLAAKLGFEVSDEIKDWIRRHPELIKNCRPQYLSKKLKKALSYDFDRTVGLIDELGLWKHLPPLPELVPYMSKAL